MVWDQSGGGTTGILPDLAGSAVAGESLRMLTIDHGATSQSPGVLVALHGHGDDSESARAWGRLIAPDGWEVVAPEAPVRSDGVNSWFSTGPRGADAGELQSQARRITDLVTQLRDDGRRTVIAGFSQGGALALVLAMSNVMADAFISICGFFPEVGPDPTEIAVDGRAEAGAQVLVLGTSEDEDVPAFLGVDAAAHLSAAGLATTALVLPGGHEVSPRVATVAANWLRRTISPRLSYSLALPVDRVDAGAELVSAEAIRHLAGGYEKLGFDAAYVTDHPAPDDRWLAGGGHHALEPTVALGVAAGATTRLRLHTNVYVLPYRNVFLAAKALASVDVLSDGRLIAGVAAGYVRPEFAALGADFETRGAQFEHSLGMLPAIWSGESVSGEGRGWKARGATSLPAPSKAPPIWVGGNSKAALRRAVQFGQGWSPMPTPVGSGKGLKTTEIATLDGLSRRLDDATRVMERHERVEPLTICFVPFSLGGYLADPVGGLDALVAEAATLAEMGVDWLALSVPGRTRSEVLAQANSLAAALGVKGSA